MHFDFATALLISIVSTGDQPTGWDTAGMTAARPAVSFYDKGRPRLVMTCEGAQTTVQVRGFKAAQQWPQPTLSVAFGTVTRSAKPDLRMIGDETAYSFEYPISDSMLDAFAVGKPIRATYRGEIRSFPEPPLAIRGEFAAKCAALVPPGMRKS